MLVVDSRQLPCQQAMGHSNHPPPPFVRENPSCPCVQVDRQTTQSRLFSPTLDALDGKPKSAQYTFSKACFVVAQLEVKGKVDQVPVVVPGPGPRAGFRGGGGSILD